MYLTLYRKYRPKNFDEIAGEKAIIKTIKNSLKEQKFSHAYLFTGPRGVGKTTLARIITKSLNCKTNGISENPCNECENCKNVDKGNFIDLIEIDAASNRGINEIRKLKDNINYKPTQGRKKVYIIDEAHMLTNEAFNALLKTLEEPPEFIVFILATTEPDKILSTIISRCQRFDFLPISYFDAKERLEYIIHSENIEIDKKSLELIYEKSGGSMRDTISLLEKVISAYYNEKITYEKTSEALGIIPQKIIQEFVELIVKNNYQDSIRFFQDIWMNGIDSERFLRELASHLKNNIDNYKNKLDIEKILKIIEKIYDVLFKFKFEEDKKMVGLVFVSEIFLKKNALSSPKPTISKSSKIESQPLVETIKKTNNDKQEEIKLDISLKTIQEKWKLVILEAKKIKISMMALLANTVPVKIDDNKLYIKFPQKNSYHLETVKKRQNYYILQEAFINVFKKNANFELIIEKKFKQKETTGDMVKEVANFFDGEII